MTEMLDRVAKAIGDHLYGYVDPKDTPNSWPKALGAARAAIEAMRDPTDAMKEAAYTHVEMDDRWMIEDDKDWARSWKGAIDAALKE